MDRIGFTQNSYLEDLSTNATVFAGRNSKEVVGPNDMKCVLTKKIPRENAAKWLSREREAREREAREREKPQETKPINTCISVF